MLKLLGQTMLKHLRIRCMLRTHVGLRLGFRYLKYLGQLLNVSKHKLFQSYRLLRLKDLRMLIMIPRL